MKVSRGNKLKALPSKIMNSNGKINSIEELTTLNKSEVVSALCSSIGNEMSRYYSLHTKNWFDILKEMNKD